MYNTKTRTHRACTIYPNKAWDLSQTKGLLGCTLRWVNINGSHLAARQVFSVKEDGQAARVGIRKDHDWVLGVQV